MRSLNQTISLFGVTQEDLNAILTASLSKGGDYSDLYFELSTLNELSLRDNEVNHAGFHTDYGMGVRVLSGEKSGYAYTEVTTLEEMIKAAKTAAAIAEYSTPKDNIVQSGGHIVASKHNYYPLTLSWEERTIAEKRPILERLQEKIYSLDKRVDKVMARLVDSQSDILIYTSEGNLCHDSRPLFSIMVSCVMEHEGEREVSSSSRSFRGGFEMISEELLNELANDVVSKTAFLFEANRPKGGEMQVVMGSGSSGILLHEAIGHAFEADFVREGVSIFAGKLGETICSPQISVVDDGTIPNNRGALNFDDEGTPSQKSYMVTNGVLTSYLHDRISAKHFNCHPTGNGRRESFRYPPLPRMRATYMEGGSGSEEDLISSVKRGIYAQNFSNGQVQIGAGDFTFYVKSGYLIENGKLTQPLKEINVIGNGPQALSDIVAVASNSVIDNSSWSCGKGQYCPVSCGMPSVLVKKLTVGGL